MNELQLSLIGLGIVGIVGVYAYNKWQERKLRKIADHVFRSQHPDVLMDGQAAATESAEQAERIEPVIGSGQESTRRETASEPVSHGPVGTADVPAPPAGWFDLSVDYVATLEAVEPISLDRILAFERNALSRLTKPVTLAGFGDQDHRWHLLDGGSDTVVEGYRALCVGLQLVDRRGPVSEPEIALFANAIQQFADESLAVCDMPPRNGALERAESLDRFCAGVDIQIGVNVIAMSGAFPGTKIRGLAEAAGLVMGGDGGYQRRDEESGTVMFSLSNFESPAFSPETMRTLNTHGITALLDLPRVANGPKVFDRMLECAEHLADALQGQVVDDNRQPLTQKSIDMIRSQIAQYQERMATQGIPAGSQLALRLFV